MRNALIKARHAALCTGLPAIADDSGLSVDALQGAPGIYSARFAGTPSDDKANIDKLLANLKDVPDDRRQASFHCVLAFLLHDKDPTPLICQGDWQGNILRHAQGNDGFGYDPVFYVPNEKRTAAELPLSEKNKISHRGKALHDLIKHFPEKIRHFKMAQK